MHLDHQHWGCPSAAWPAQEPISWWAQSGAREPLCEAGSLSNVLGTSQRHCTTPVSLSSLSLPVPPHFPRYLYWCSPRSPLLSRVRASWACYPNPTVVVAFVSLTRGPALYTCQRANESNKQGPEMKGGQVSAVLLSFTGFLAAALPWKLGTHNLPLWCLMMLWL